MCSLKVDKGKGLAREDTHGGHVAEAAEKVLDGCLVRPHGYVAQPQVLAGLRDCTNMPVLSIILMHQNLQG